MAKRIRITLEWENGDFFELSEKVGDDPQKVITHNDENANLKAIWKHIEAACQTYFNDKIREIGEEMKK